jgi:hypothetical protein
MKALIHRRVGRRLHRVGDMLGVRVGARIGVDGTAADHDRSHGARKGRLGGLR